MRYITPLVIIALLVTLSCSAQKTPNQTLNLSFEQTNDLGQVTGCSYSSGNNDYFSYKDDSVKIDGNRSIRLQKEMASLKSGFGVITFSLPANFKGTKITLTGYIKTEAVKDGYAGLWLRSDAGTEAIGFNNMREEGVVGTQDWKQYSITVPMNERVSNIIFGGILTGTGKSWFDNLALLVDDKPVESITWIPGMAKTVRRVLTFSGVTIDSVLTARQKENLYVLGKLWGFLKYHHPDVAKGNYDFDSSLFSIMPKLLKTSSTSERDEVLINWINTLGDENKYPAVSAFDTAAAHTRPNLQWLNDETIFSASLIARLNNIYQHRNKGTNYYVRLQPGVGNPIFDKEAGYRQVPAVDDGFRMLALFRYWNMIEYFFPYKHLLQENWSDVLKEFVPAFAANRSALNYRLACLRLINRVHDTHANIYGDPVLQDYFGRNSAALDFKVIDNKVVVTGSLNDSLAAFETLQPGDEIVSVNGKKISEIKNASESYLCASNPSVADRNFIERILFKSNDDSLLITYKRGGKPGKTVLRLYPPGKAPYQNGDNWRMPMYKLLSPDIGYINVGKAQADSLAIIFKNFENTKGIIIDIRNYPKEFMPFALGEFIKNSSSAFVKFTSGDISNPGLFSFTPVINNGPKKSNAISSYKGSVIILVNEQTQSAAEYAAMALRTAPRSVVMGSQTAGADGNISYVPFPGGFSSPFSGIGVFYPDGKETQGVGIVPDIVSIPSQKGVTDGRDEVLEKAKEYIRKTKAF